MACFRSAELNEPGAPTARHDELNEIYKFLQVRRGSARRRLSRIADRAQRLTGIRFKAFGSGEITFREPLRLQRAGGSSRKVSAKGW